MEEDERTVTERILDLTLEIICLLTGETFTAVKSGELVAIMVPPFPFMVPEITDQQRLLEITNKMIGLLMGERGVLGHWTITGKEETSDKNLGTKELGDSIEEKELLKEAMMDHRPGLPPSQDPAQEAPTIPHHDQIEDLVVVKVVDTDDEDATSMMEGQANGERRPRAVWRLHPDPAPRVRKSDSQEISPGYLPPRNCVQEAHEMHHRHQASEICPLWPPDFMQSDQEIPPHIQSEDLIVVKVGVKEEEEEPSAGRGQQAAEEVEICLNVKVGEMSADNPAQERDRLTLPPNHLLEDDDTADSFPVELPVGANRTASHSPRRHARDEGNERFFCSCGKGLTSKYNLMIHQRVHTGERPFSCAECGRSFTRKENLQNHQKLHSGHKAFECYKCAKRFIKPSSLIRHLKTHTVNRVKAKNSSKAERHSPPSREVHNVHNSPEETAAAQNPAECPPTKPPTPAHCAAKKGQFCCSVCGKGFGSNFNLQVHQRVHTGERPFSCPDCGRSFTRKENLKRHQVTHSGEKLYPCPDCGKHFTQKGSAMKHWRTHSGAGNCRRRATTGRDLKQEQEEGAHKSSDPLCSQC